MIRLTDRNGRVTEYQYDDAGRRTAEIWLDEEEEPLNTIAYAYDDANRLIEASDTFSSYTLSYDVTPVTGISRWSSITRVRGRPACGAHDADGRAGRLIRATDADPDFDVATTLLTAGDETHNEVQQITVSGVAMAPVSRSISMPS